MRRSLLRLQEVSGQEADGRWSRNNRYLLSASLDSTAIIWDLSFLPNPLLRPSGPVGKGCASASTQRVRTIRFDAPVASASFHPRNHKIILATLACNELVLVDLREGGGKWVLEDVMEGEKQAEAMDVDREGDVEEMPVAEEKK